MQKIGKLLKHEATGGVLIIIASLLALLFQNTILTEFYNEFLRLKSGIVLGEYKIIKPLILWVNDGLMALFFFYIGLEVKREILVGELRTPSRVVLPVVGGIGGVVVPALCFLAFTYGDDFAMRGWAIPTVSDTAFAVGILLLLGSKVPSSLKLFLLLLAIIDDICAVVIVAFFYTSELSNFALIMAGVLICVLFILNVLKVNKFGFYAAAMALLWVSFLESGVHSTIAGVIAAFFIPLKPIKGYSMLRYVENSLKNFITYIVMPLFAFVNAGIPLTNEAFGGLMHPASLGIIFGLVLAKPLGVFAFSYVVIKLKLANLPMGANYKQFLGLAFLTGIGASMSLFIDSIAYNDSNLFFYADKLAILIASFLAAIIGYQILNKNATKQEPVKAIVNDEIGEDELG
ncbi:Na+/H+ antiporter NhaA [Campylobacter sp. FMV-PI01]|uniref:Na(+)/H(+) antiporter NhaA n=1 Tax=Campylobacter portucalensis TaxID=2608384 RepID=A0A6L5WG01_9BACT|nr:Na+/H+ antiporter NhaA [Campylobacter portucalensis]MSN95646.1 Na+/H+ antiporter NhaA [Campylobacter portucalensis]